MSIMSVITPVRNTPAIGGSPFNFHFTYTVQTGYFAQSEEATNDQDFDFKNSNFGLINRSYDMDDGSKEHQWSRFDKYVREREGKAQKGQSFKVLFLGRHGQGWHNVAEEKYGTEAWDCYWSALDGADELTWFDALLTRLGREQALSAHKLWKDTLPLGIPPPESYYVSPMTRAIETADLTFQQLSLPAGKGKGKGEGKAYKPMVKENLREVMGIHTCDKRSTRSVLQDRFPHLVFEPGFTQDDELWEPDYREPRSARHYRLGLLLDDIFAHDESLFVSLTAHSGAIASILEVIGHREFRLETGGVIPVFLSAQRKEERRHVPEKESSDSPPMCKEPPTM